MKFGDKILSVYHDQFERQYNYLFCLPSILKDDNNSIKKLEIIVYMDNYYVWSKTFSFVQIF